MAEKTPKILIVDDVKTNVLIIKKTVEKLGYFAITAHSGFEALQKVQKSCPDLVLLDINMPDMDGYNVCRKIKAMEDSQDIPVIMVTGETNEKALQKAFDAGASDYVPKKSTQTELVARIRSAIILKREVERRKQRESELLDATKRLEQHASVDALTGIANRRHFDEFLEKEWRRGMRYKLPLSLVMIEVDNFRKYVEAHGQKAGDTCLQKIAAILSARLKRPGDLVARFAIEGFAAVLFDTKPKEVKRIAEDIRDRIEKLQLSASAGVNPASVIVSVGVATDTPARGSNAKDLLELADIAVARARQSGKNQVKIANT